jgi:hypothetical protein
MFHLDAATGKYVLTGITTDGVDSLSRFGDVSWGTRVLDYDAFISSIVPEPVGLVPAALGLIFALKRRGKSQT